MNETFALHRLKSMSAQRINCPVPKVLSALPVAGNRTTQVKKHNKTRMLALNLAQRSLVAPCTTTARAVSRVPLPPNSYQPPVGCDRFRLPFRNVPLSQSAVRPAFGGSVSSQSLAHTRQPVNNQHPPTTCRSVRQVRGDLTSADTVRHRRCFRAFRPSVRPSVRFVQSFVV